MIFSCAANSPTQVVLAIDTDFTVPEELDGLEITVSLGLDDTTSITRSIALISKTSTETPQSNQLQLPLTLPISAGTHVEEIVYIKVIGKKSNAPVVMREASAAFVKDSARLLRILLTRNCKNKPCNAQQTCDRGTCIDITISDPLPRYDDDLVFQPHEDSGIDDGTIIPVDTNNIDITITDSNIVDTITPDSASCSTGNSCYTGPEHSLLFGICKQGICQNNQCTDEVLPKAEDCSTAEDDNCNGTINEGCACDPDTDDPQFCGIKEGLCDDSLQVCSKTTKKWTECIGAIMPATEICDGEDNDCDGTKDEGFSKTTYYRDSDGDGFGVTTVTTQSCFKPNGYAAKGGDCDDSNETVFPGQTRFFKTAKPGAQDLLTQWDYNCDGTIEYSYDGTNSTNPTQAGNTPWAHDKSYGNTCHSYRSTSGIPCREIAIMKPMSFNVKYCGVLVTKGVSPLTALNCPSNANDYISCDTNPTCDYANRLPCSSGYIDFDYRDSTALTVLHCR